MILSKTLPLLLVLGVFLVFTTATNPNTVSLPLLILPFLFIGYILYKTIQLARYFMGKQGGNHSGKLIALSIAMLGVLLLLLQSLNQLSWRDGLLACVFVAMFWFYVWRADFLHK